MTRQTRAVTEPQREGSTQLLRSGDEGYFNPPEAPQLFIMKRYLRWIELPHPSPDVRTGDTFPTEGEGVEEVFPLVLLTGISAVKRCGEAGRCGHRPLRQCVLSFWDFT